MTDIEARVLAVLKTLQEAPYISVIQRRARLSEAEMRTAEDGLVADGLIRVCFAPQGRLLYPTLRGAELLRANVDPAIPL